MTWFERKSNIVNCHAIEVLGGWKFLSLHQLLGISCCPRKSIARDILNTNTMARKALDLYLEVR
jgi:hypothetical protein